MPVFNNLDELYKYVEKNVSSIAENELFDEIKDTFHKHVIEDVYDTYEPKKYLRRHGAGGLADESNIELTSFKDNGGSVSMEIENTATGRTPTKSGYRENGVRIDYQIETGIYMWTNSDGEPGARPFIENTVNELERKDICHDVLTKELKNRGFKAE